MVWERVTTGFYFRYSQGYMLVFLSCGILLSFVDLCEMLFVLKDL